MTLPSHLQNIINALPNLAIKSSITFKHGAVLVKNGKPIVWGFNSIKGAETCHAEVDVMRRYLNLHKIPWPQKQPCLQGVY